MRGFLVGALAAAAMWGSVAEAAVVRDCTDFTANAQNIVQPWEKFSRTFYKGQVRVALLDTGGEPVCCSAHLLVLIPPNDDEPGGGQMCFVISEHSNFGYGNIGFEKLSTAYDSNRGLLITVPAIISNGEDETRNVVLKVRVNVAKHSVKVEK